MRSRGFTLIELMIVVLIIGILAAIAIPKFADVSDNAKAAAIVADARTIVSAAQFHFTDKGYYPDGSPAGVIPDDLEDYLGEEFDFSKYQESGVFYSLENYADNSGAASSNGGAVTISINSDNQEMLNRIFEASSGLFVAAPGYYGSDRLAIVVMADALEESEGQGGGQGGGQSGGQGGGQGGGQSGGQGGGQGQSGNQGQGQGAGMSGNQGQGQGNI